MTNPDFSVKSVLIVDDSESDIFLATYCLKRSGSFEQVWSLPDGVAALDVLKSGLREHPQYKEHPPDLILLDINMPAMDGFEFLERFQMLPIAKKASVVMVTSSDHLGDQERAESYSVVSGYLVKPLTESDALALACKFGTRKTA